MRDVNFFSVLNNKAAANMTPTMYDRRALDCPFDRPLVNSLSSLCVLISSSQVIRESLASDGGIDRLVSILRSCTGMHSRDLLTSWKWSLALQCLSSVGVRGTEVVRRRVVDADVVPVLATILDNFLEAIEKLRLYHDVYAKYSDILGEERRRPASRMDDSETESLLTQPTTASLASRLATTETGPDTAGAADQTDDSAAPLFDSGIDVSAAGIFMSLVGPAAEDPQVQAEMVEPMTTPSEAESSMNTAEADSGDIPAQITNNNAYFNRIHYHMYHHHRHHHRHHHSHSHSNTRASTAIQPASSTDSSADGTAVDEDAMTGISAAATSSDIEDAAASMDIDEDVVAPSSSLATVAMDADDTHTSSDDAAFESGMSSSTLNAPRMLDMDYSSGYRNTSTSTSPSQARDSGSTDVTADGSSAARSPVMTARPSPLFEASAAAAAVASREAVETSPIQTGTQTEGSVPGTSTMPSSFPAFLGAQDNMPREEDVLLSLQLLAYVSKYVNLRQCFQKTHLVPALSMRPELRAKVAEEQIRPGNKNKGFDDPSLDPEDESLIEDEYKLPTINLFQLVERFTTRAYSEGDLSYWASIIMRNSCRKDESRGGVRQCGYFECGRWEEYPKQFAKCRRCRRTKYCSKACQSKAWSFHRHWCVPPGQEAQMMNR
ncbi:uncharacterized protein V2V93DRAFT_181582 [Kockiozyma suomiensis]|uniref:uncharacterized protein n=1 Tax=Kockiozyma suomiensis TaxID=1337062 RepID=UPI003343B3F1